MSRRGMCWKSSGSSGGQPGQACWAGASLALDLWQRITSRSCLAVSVAWGSVASEKATTEAWNCGAFGPSFSVNAMPVSESRSCHVALLSGHGLFRMSGVAAQSRARGGCMWGNRRWKSACLAAAGHCALSSVHDRVDRRLGVTPQPTMCTLFGMACRRVDSVTCTAGLLAPAGSGMSW